MGPAFVGGNSARQSVYFERAGEKLRCRGLILAHGKHEIQVFTEFVRELCARHNHDRQWSKVCIRTVCWHSTTLPKVGASATLENGRKIEQTKRNTCLPEIFQVVFLHLTKFVFPIFCATLVWTGPAFSQSCRTISAQGQAPYFAENFPLPLSLRSNLIFLMKEEMAARGEYDASLTSAVFTTLLESQIKQAQARLGHDVTGCITWELIEYYDSQGRTPPPESVR